MRTAKWFTAIQIYKSPEREKRVFIRYNYSFVTNALQIGWQMQDFATQL